jgi:hypothetical protein
MNPILEDLEPWPEPDSFTLNAGLWRTDKPLTKLDGTQVSGIFRLTEETQFKLAQVELIQIPE